MKLQQESAKLDRKVQVIRLDCRTEGRAKIAQNLVPNALIGADFPTGNCSTFGGNTQRCFSSHKHKGLWSDPFFSIRSPLGQIGPTRRAVSSTSSLQASTRSLRHRPPFLAETTFRLGRGRSIDRRSSPSARAGGLVLAVSNGDDGSLGLTMN